MADAALDVLSWIARGVGLFHVFGGLMVRRATRAARLLDAAIAALALPLFEQGRLT